MHRRHAASRQHLATPLPQGGLAALRAKSLTLTD